jgi:branched-chain amino acid transport system ATP-binding protein
LIEHLREIPPRFGCGIVVVEHDMRVIMGVSQRVHVLDHGVTLAVGTPAEIRTDDRVIRAYFGGTALQRIPDISAGSE